MFKLAFAVTTILFFGVLNVLGLPKDKNVTISSSNQSYEFVFNAKTQQVEIKQKLITNYYCNGFREVIPITEMYNDQVSIDDVDFNVDGRRDRTIKPEYTYYKIRDVFYSDERVCYFPLALEKKGATGKVTFEETVKDPKYFTSIFFPEHYKVLHKEVTIKIPRWMKVDIKELNFAGADITKTTRYDSHNDADVITFTINNLAAEEQEDNSPGPTYVLPHLLIQCKSSSANGNQVTYFNELKDQYAWYHLITKDMGNDKAVLKAKALEIVKDKTADMDKIKAVFYWMQKNIHYLAFENGMAGFKPEKADEVLRKNYGDCKGMAHLTKELLCALGYDARLCWIGTNHIAYDYSTPSLAVDNHMICALIFKGKTYFLDATETYNGFDEYAERIQGRQVLIENGDQYILTHVPATTFAQNLDSEKRRISIAGTDIQGIAEHVWKGEEKEYMLGNLNDMQKNKSGEALDKYLSNRNSDYVISNLITSDLNDIDRDLSISYTLSFKNGVSRFGKDYYVDMDQRKELNGWNIDTAQRSNDYWFDYKMNISRQTELTVPAGYRVTSLPPNLAIQNNNYEFTIQYSKQNDKVLYKKSIVLKNTRIAKSQFALWNNDIAKLTEAYNQQLVLTAQ
ncbi:transglutaminase-like domain-containing protein [Mucilaginibacter paludis]|uniref:Transglutaminase domain-containing protein n=1 Tax=Mucilaginibacter paludis DSM 18603 TaxID=714943 RepID=H1Y2E2_9SPHI|nr:transglutaminase-like domain-containing protein [Mucilaginibacter paludis]EHQ27922.1 transglutaminase domain-containing protein [Mucilaginibacter paludis DSM 18603]